MKSVDGGPSWRSIYCCVNCKKDAAVVVDDDDDEDDDDDTDDTSIVTHISPPGKGSFSTAELKAVVFKNKMPTVVLKIKPKVTSGDSAFLNSGDSSLFGPRNTSESVADSPGPDGKRKKKPTPESKVKKNPAGDKKTSSHMPAKNILPSVVSSQDLNLNPTATAVFPNVFDPTHPPSMDGIKKF
jgi:hypothetical protein